MNEETKQYYREYYQKNKKRILENRKIWLKKNPYYYKTPERLEHKRERDKIYSRRKRANGKINKTEEYRIWREKNPEKVRAHQSLNRKIKSGEIKREPCQICGKIKVHAHHEDYNKPLEVVWLCPAHHQQLHLGQIKL